MHDPLTPSSILPYYNQVPLETKETGKSHACRRSRSARLATDLRLLSTVTNIPSLRNSKTRDIRALLHLKVRKNSSCID